MSEAALKSWESDAEKKVYVFDLFIGTHDEKGVVCKNRSVGFAVYGEGQNTYKVHLKTLLNLEFFLMREKKLKGVDYAILTREPARNVGRKYFWHTVGIGNLLTGSNSGLMSLRWDLFAENIYIDLNPKEVREANNLWESGSTET